MAGLLRKVRKVLGINAICFIRCNFLSRNIRRKRGCYLIPLRGSIIRIHPTAVLELNGNLLFNAGTYPGSRAEAYLILDEGARMRIDGDSRFNYGSTVHLCPDATLEIGSCTTNVGVNFQIKMKATIGKDCMFGRNVFLFDSTFHPTGMTADAMETNTKEVIIGNHVWTGANAFIIAGTRLGDGCILGSGTYVSGEIPPYATVARHGDVPALMGNMWARSENSGDIERAVSYYAGIDRQNRGTNGDDSYRDEIIRLLHNSPLHVDCAASKRLVSDHVIDSLSLINIVTLLEGEYGVKIPYFEITPVNFDNPLAMSSLVARLTAGHGGVEAKGAKRRIVKRGTAPVYTVEPQTTLIEYVRVHALNDPEKLAVISCGNSYSYGELYELARGYGSFLTGQGVKRGDRIVVKAIQSIEYIIIYLGTHYAGAVITTVEKTASGDRVNEIAKAVDASCVISDEPVGIDLRMMRFIDSRNVFADCRDAGIAEIPFPGRDDSADILFTTGTTGQAKGVELSHAAVIAGAENIAAGCKMTRETLLVVPNPLSHSNAIKNMAACFIIGCTFYVLDGITDLKAYFAALDCDYGEVATVLPPAAIHTIFRLAKDKLGEYADRLTYLMAATAPLPESDREQLRQLLPKTRLYNHYGCSESSSICIYDFNRYSELRNCVGKAMPHSQVFFVDDHRRAIKSSADNIGLLAVRGDATMKGYYREPELTAQVKDGDVIYTRDMGYMDSDGFVYILGRSDDIINVGGLKVSPLDVEAAALACPGVADCICVGIPDVISGQALKLLIVPGDRFDMDELHRTLALKLDGYRCPGNIELVDRVERTYNGKLNRKAYRV